MRRVFLMLLWMCVAHGAAAQTNETVSPIQDQHHASEMLIPDSQPATLNESRPMLADDPYWTPIAFILIGMMFLSAMVIGPIVRLNMPEEIPPAHSHDEPPGTSHHHGKSGTINPAPEADLNQHGH